MELVAVDNEGHIVAATQLQRVNNCRNIILTQNTYKEFIFETTKETLLNDKNLTSYEKKGILDVVTNTLKKLSFDDEVIPFLTINLMDEVEQRNIIPYEASGAYAIYTLFLYMQTLIEFVKEYGKDYTLNFYNGETYV